MSKVTMQDIADALGISRITVWKVFNKQNGVSDELRTQIFDMARTLGYAKISTALPTTAEEEKTVSVIVSRPDSAMFWTNIIHDIAKEFAGNNVNLLYNYAPSIYRDDYTLPSVLTSGMVSGIIIINIYDEKLLQMINQLSLPKVFLDTVSDIKPFSLTGDVILLEGTNTICTLTEHVIEKGCKRIGFIGDIQYAKTNYDRYQGYLRAMSLHQLPVKADDCLTGTLGINTYHDEIFQFLDHFDADLPDAIICASDYVAHFVWTYIEDHHITIPDQFMLVGYDGTTEYDNVSDILTTAIVDTAALGKRLARQLSMRIQHPDDPYEVIYVNPAIRYSHSTKADIS